MMEIGKLVAIEEERRVVQIIPAPPDFWVRFDGEVAERVTVIALMDDGTVRPMFGDLSCPMDSWEVVEPPKPDWVTATEREK